MSSAYPDEEGGKDEIQAKIVADALQKVDKQKEEKGSYFGLVPEEYQRRVIHMVEDNFSRYRDQFGNNIDLFREAMARNWLVKKEAFDGLAEQAGMRKVNSMREVRANPNDVKVALLSASSSYLLVGKEAFDKSGPGASFEYVRIPFREGEKPEGHKIEGVKVELGGIFEFDPKVGARAEIHDKNDSKNNRRTSNVMAMYVLEDQTRPNLTSESVTQSFIDVDAKTITQYKLKDGK